MNPFSLWLALGVTLGLWQVAHSGPPRARFARLGLGLAVLMAALIGARLGYVILHPTYFRAHPLVIPQVWQGGLSGVGALLGGLVGLGGLAWGLRRSWLVLGADLLPLLPTVTAAAWLGCWDAGCAYGPSAPAGAWWALPIRDEWGHTTLRWPLQPLAAMSLLALFWAMERRWQEPPAAHRVGWGGLVFALHTVLFSLARADEPPTWNAIRLDLALGTLLGAGCLILLLWNMFPIGRKTVS
ncbi:prolipoprotein diacylglyceryl transferase [Thermanaerothrix sp. 4228-RoL]|uniref:Prolipoprotein diacylglyceryl transferase n=1 Tax=Thermanaerothrix solaris TaxID=3058434 RepID=A0ABU3NMT8_9CHLR|nr:prolipoprotein diacylglyceryl transferase family protein [Thermanaerothrix sp. 4228-RoL]MDT8898170.1 prolipoprotein diacylglyceryl transferase [Thermanaerothrix sp. 4228-RoL]